jgi:hypothetical protein
MKSLFKKKSKQYSNISEPVSDLDPQRIASLKSRNYSDLDPEVIRKIKLQHLNHQSESNSTLSQTGGVATAVSRTNSSTTHATMPSTDQTEHSSGSQNSGSAQSLSVSNAVLASGNTFPAPPGSPSKSKRKLFLLKKKQATNASNSPTSATIYNNKDTKIKTLGQKTAVPMSQKKSFKDMSSRLKATDTIDSSAPTEKMVLTSNTSTHKTSSVPVTPDTLDSQRIPHPQNVSNDYLDQYDDDDDMDAGTDAPTEFFQPSYLFKDAINQSYDEIIPDDSSGHKAEIQKTGLENTSLDHEKARNNGPTTKTQLSINNGQLETPPPPPTKRLSGFRKRSPTPPPNKQKHSSQTMKGITKRRQNHDKNLIFHDIGTSSTCSELDKTFDPEIVSVSSDITSPTFQPLDTATGISSSLHGNKNTSPSTTWREKIHLSLTKSCANNDNIKMGTRRNSFWDTFVDGLCSSKPVSTVNDSSDHGDEVHDEL